MPQNIAVPPILLNDGKSIPAIGLGTWKSKGNQAREAVKYALLEAGYRHIDTAAIFGNEEEIGKALNEVFASGKLDRDDVFITNKVWNTHHARSRVLEACRMSLKALNLDYFDLYLIHWPMGYKDSRIYSRIDYLETWHGMEDSVFTKLVKSIGVANFNHKQIERLLANCTLKPVINQIEVHPYLTQEQLVEFCKSRGIQVTAYSPLGSPDRPWAKPDDPRPLNDPKILSIAKNHNRTPAQILIRFAIERDLIVTPKSADSKRIASNIKVFDFGLSEDEMKIIYSLNRNQRFVAFDGAEDHPHYPFNSNF